MSHCCGGDDRPAGPRLPFVFGSDRSGAMWELIPKILAPVVPVVMGLSRFRKSLQPRPRSNLKADCEMLTMRKKVGAAKSCSAVENHIDEQVARLYGRGTASQSRLHQIWKHSTPPLRVVLGTLVLGSGIAGTAYLVRHGFTWWSLLSGYVALAGIGVISTGFDPRHQLRHKYNALGERSFELFKDKTLDQTLDSEVAELVKDIETLRHR